MKKKKDAKELFSFLAHFSVRSVERKKAEPSLIQHQIELINSSPFPLTIIYYSIDVYDWLKSKIMLEIILLFLIQSSSSSDLLGRTSERARGREWNLDWFFHHHHYQGSGLEPTSRDRENKYSILFRCCNRWRTSDPIEPEGSVSFSMSRLSFSRSIVQGWIVKAWRREWVKNPKFPDRCSDWQVLLLHWIRSLMVEMISLVRFVWVSVKSVIAIDDGISILSYWHFFSFVVITFRLVSLPFVRSFFSIAHWSTAHVWAFGEDLSLIHIWRCRRRG